jgi:hypothetical protein
LLKIINIAEYNLSKSPHRLKGKLMAKRYAELTGITTVRAIGQKADRITN